MLLYLMSLLAATAPAPAIDPAQTVTAEKIAPERVEPLSRAYVKAALPTPTMGQYARWQIPVCIKIIGLEDEVAARVAGRIAGVAAASRIPVAGATCSPNLIVWFSKDARRDVAAILAGKPSSTAGISTGDRERLLNAPMPVRWWHTAQAGSSDGTGMGRESNATTTAQFVNNDGTGTGVGGPQTATTSSYSSSLIDTHLNVGIVYAAAAVDIPLTEGHDLDSVANYVALVTLGAMPLDVAKPEVPSVLGLFTAPPGALETRLSAWDKAYLDALYKIAMNRTATRQRGQLLTAMTRSMKP